jgi:5-oxopent-3-ene-1,2,5-tricarboxylate decarboxylase/2-hydroxyhepta-2,4-diene-1,7-dioate isomerase
VARLIADVSTFMTLAAGDLLLLGVAAGAPRARAGQRVRIEIDGIGALENPLVSEAAA